MGILSRWRLVGPTTFLFAQWSFTDKRPTDPMICHRAYTFLSKMRSSVGDNFFPFGPSVLRSASLFIDVIFSPMTNVCTYHMLHDAGMAAMQNPRRSI